MRPYLDGLSHTSCEPVGVTVQNFDIVNVDFVSFIVITVILIIFTTVIIIISVAVTFITVADPGGGWGGGLCPLFWSFFFNKNEVYEQNLVLNEYEIYLKILEMAVLETQIFKNFWPHAPRPHWKIYAFVARVALPPPPPPLLKVLDPPLHNMYNSLKRIPFVVSVSTDNDGCLQIVSLQRRLIGSSFQQDWFSRRLLVWCSGES